METECSNPPQLLLVEENEMEARRLGELLQAEPTEGIAPTVERTVHGAVSRLSQGGWDLILANLMLSDSAGIETFVTLQSHAGAVPIVVLTGLKDEHTAMEAVRLGAQSYLVKEQMDGAIVERTVCNAIERPRYVTIAQSLSLLNQQTESVNAVQQSLYPQVAPNLPDFDVYGAAFPAGAGCGDYFDFLTVDNNEHVFVIADVAGHGLEAAVLMVETRAILRTLIRERRPIAVTLSTLNSILSSDLPVGRFVTLFLAKLNLRSRVFTWSSAGHESTLLRTPVATRLRASGAPLGLHADEYSESSISLDSGDTVLMLTDGFQEAQSPCGELFGAERLEAIACEHADWSAQRIIAEFYHNARRHAQGVQQDDMAGIVIRAL